MKANTCSNETQEKDILLDEIISKHKDTKGALIPILHEAQDLYGYLPAEVQSQIAKKLRIPLSEIYGVISFYHQFSLKPKGKYKISICMGTACYVKGAGAILDKLKEELNIDLGDTTEDGDFTLEECRCIGACGLAPVLTINDEVYGRLVKDDVGKIIDKCRNEGKV